MRILVTGAGGGLGRALVEVLGGLDHDVRALTHAELDIGDGAAVGATVDEVRPAVILNAAAFTKVDACEDEANIDAAVAGNALGPWKLAEAAAANGAIIVHVSTDYVFDGEKGSAYDERDETRPTNRYGMLKAFGEEHVRSTSDRHVIVRTGFVFGGGSDYLTGALRRLREGEPAGGLVDRIGTPTYMRHLAERLLPLALTERFGTYHLAGPEPTTWHDVLLRAKALGDLAGDVREQRAAELDLPAPRPRNSALTSVLLPDLADEVPPMPPLDEGIRAALSRL
ncbi:MAG TPA: NAD(P)-dependent oxidoreductase [Actinomycetota bacterium]|nr:NAD(P)-dependent oxidoreductase [Actinomycetota bacterium]